jgi:hypothetical protein
MEVESSRIQAANWAGSIPVILTLAPSSLSSPTLPPPIHVLVHNYLHLALEEAVRKLHEFAPMTIFFRGGIVRNEPDPGPAFQENGGETTKTNQSAADNKNNNNNMYKAALSSKRINHITQFAGSKMKIARHHFVGIFLQEFCTTCKEGAAIIPPRKVITSLGKFDCTLRQHILPLKSCHWKGEKSLIKFLTTTKIL